VRRKYRLDSHGSLSGLREGLGNSIRSRNSLNSRLAHGLSNGRGNKFRLSMVRRLGRRSNGSNRNGGNWVLRNRVLNNWVWERNSLLGRRLGLNLGDMFSRRGDLNRLWLRRWRLGCHMSLLWLGLRSRGLRD
jgi:hypothetical protein